MTLQIEQLIEDIRVNFNEDDSIMLKAYITRLEDQSKKLEKEIEYWKLSFNKQVHAERKTK